ncbi:hypothetical protein N658DRAFT_516125 [Parathielavia hyrcaniae]|uniref:Uncharacterized protein n=1 Tax=Parathielavia hyrcaniae TaxID=113614 RepID=A0AAN6Q3X6_9PEZI|nr:hypothetical protein N658DRAFT_516125 [Parathielavia hyrcaniae]
MFGGLFTCLRLLRRLLWWSFLITLPFHFLPFLNGLIEGVLLSNMLTETYHASLDNFGTNVESAAWMDWYSVPGGPGIHDLATAPFHLIELRDPQSWWERLGLRRFDIDVTDDIAMDEYPIDSLASLEALYRRAPKHGEAQRWHHFIYASPSRFHIEELWFSEWDRAFNELLQYHYANPPPTGARFHCLTCPGNFLCDIWATRGPAMLHFTTDSPDEFDELEERVRIPGYLPVTVRIIEFPLTDPEKLALLPGQFPSPFNQLRSVTSHPQTWQLHQPFSKVDQFIKRLYDTCDEAEKEYAQTYGRLRRLENWIENKLGLEDSLWPAGARLPTLFLSFAAKEGLGHVWEFVKTQSTELRKRYWGKNKGEEVLEWLDERAKQKEKEKEKEEGKEKEGAGDDEEEGERRGRPAAQDFFEENAEAVCEIGKSNPGHDEFLNKIWDLMQKKEAKGSKKKD